MSNECGEKYIYGFADLEPARTSAGRGSYYRFIILCTLWQYSLQEFKWERCKRLISGEEKIKTTQISSNDSEILSIYRPDQDCASVLQTRFVHPPVSKEEKQLPIAFSLTVYKGSRLLDRILRAIYMPNNVYCIHIDKKSSEIFRKAIQAVIRCLPNVFIAANSVDVIWGHISLVQAQFSCMEELLKSSVKWKYYISLVGQDFPLYDNKQIVQALQGLNNTNNIASFPVPKNDLDRTKFVHILKGRKLYKTRMPKVLPPHNILIYKGSTHIIAIREFVEFVLHSQIGKDFYEFLKNTGVPDETIYSSLQQHPGVPGGINGNQPMWIPRALYWISDQTRDICRGLWVRQLCWISLQDLRWALGEDKKDKLFVQKIPFNFSEELIECILVARQGRKYATSAWKEEKRISKRTSLLTTVAPTVEANGRPCTAKEQGIGLPTKQKSKVSGNRTDDRTDTSKDKVENVHGTPRLKVKGTAGTSNVQKRRETNKKDVSKTPTPRAMQERNKQKTSNNKKIKSDKKTKFNETRPSGPFTEKPKVTPIKLLFELCCMQHFLSAHNLLTWKYTLLREPLRKNVAI